MLHPVAVDCYLEAGVSSVPVKSLSPFLQAVCALWIVGFLFFFFSQDLANNLNNQTVSRTDIGWLTLIDLPELLNPFDVSHAAARGVDSGWHLVPQRWRYFRVAGLLFMAAITIGTVVARVLMHPVPLARCERFVVQAGLGLSFQSLWTLMIGLAGRLSFITVMLPGAIAFAYLIGSAVLSRIRQSTVCQRRPECVVFEPASRKTWAAAGLTAFPFLILLCLNGFTPPWEFDVREYHLQGPKEWFQAGQIMFLEHNVYTSFPFLSEMLSLNAVVLADDWNDGAISAKVVLAGYQLLTMLCVFVTGRRWFGTSAGLLAAVVYLSVPWTLRVSLIAYAEGAITFFLMATVMCGLITVSQSDPARRNRLLLTTGLLAGSAMAAKYPGVISVVIPVGLLLLWSIRAQRQMLLSTALLYGAGVMLTVGPWLVRNTIDTGNPVYPLMYGVFGADDWSPAMDVKWKNGHLPSHHDPASIPSDLLSVLVFSDWTSGLLFGLAVPTLLLLRHNRQSRWLWIMVVWMLVTWWALTHRLDRFWIPIIPVAAVLAGASWSVFRGVSWRTLLLVCVAGCSLFNLQFWRTPLLTGMQAGLMDLKSLQSVVVRGDIRVLNSDLSPDDRILMIGEAEVFDLAIPCFYNTVFDESLFEQWTADETDERHWSAERRMKKSDDVLDVLKQKGITHLYVNWLEILRYRGSYGYTEYVTPERLRQLVDAGVLGEPTVLFQGDWEELKEKEHKLIESWSGYNDLLIERPFGDGHLWEPIRLYEVAE